jgi:Fe-S cluster assembly scaffold protein SufB
MAMIVNGFIEPIAGAAHGVRRRVNRLIELQMEGAVG